MSLAEELLRRGGPWLLAFDVDGTLAPIVTDAAKAKVPAGTLERLRALHAMENVEVAFLTGRDAPALARMLPMGEVWRAVDHGLVVLPPGVTDTPKLTEAERESLTALSLFVESLGLRSEHKERSVAAHSRGIDGGEAKLPAFEAEAKARGFHVRHGRALVEASFESADKAPALERIAEALGAETLFFAGDDLTDFGAIRFAGTRGAGVFVQSDEGPEAPEGAHIALGPAGLLETLDELLGLFAAR